MTDEKNKVADAIIRAAHIISNNDARTFDGTQLGGLEAHSMQLSNAIEGLAESVQAIADQMERIADSIEEQRHA